MRVLSQMRLILSLRLLGQRARGAFFTSTFNIDIGPVEDANVIIPVWIEDRSNQSCALVCVYISIHSHKPLCHHRLAYSLAISR